ncbi:hypothetical protein DMUE_5542 [Dictyocoela muelleri]|nr:hypothetical protein DMUE_5542 [Dictyocoela muelleri]
MILALAFVTPNNINDEVNKLNEYIMLRENLCEIRNIWIEFRNHYCNDLNNLEFFLISFWSVVSRIINEISTTTNFLEGWHRSLNHKFLKSHQSILLLGIELKKQHAFTENKITKLFLNSYDLKYNELKIFTKMINNYDKYPGLQYLKIVSQGRFF